MKVNCALPILNEDDKPIQLAEDGDKKRDALLRDFAGMALLGHQEEKMGGQEKVRRYDLWMKIRKADEVDLSAEDIVLIKKVVGETCITLVAAQICKALDPVAST